MVNPFTLWFRPACSWRVVLSASLLVAYVVLAGEALHCRYVSGEHSQHGSSPSPAADTHAIHCILANHSSATLPSVASLNQHPLLLVSSVALFADTVGPKASVPSAAARAPPFA